MAMSDTDPIAHILAEIQSTLAGMRHDRMVMPILNRHDSSIDGLSAEVRALRSQFDRSRNEARAFQNEMRDFQNEMRDFQNEMRERLSRIEDALLREARQ
jgi:predicted  nucleic acid-binding Zn-ribbon protein